MTTQTLSIQVIIGAVLLLLSMGTLAWVSAMNIRNAQFPSERRFMVWATLGFWVFLILLLVAMYYILPPWRYVLLAIYFIHIPIMVYQVSLRRQIIREYELRAAGSKPGSDAGEG